MNKEKKLDYLKKDFSEAIDDDHVRYKFLKSVTEYGYYIPYFLLVEELGIRIEYGGEKIAWRIPFVYKDKNFFFILMKSGFKLYGPENENKLLNELEKVFIKYKNIVGDIHKEKIERKIKEGNITIQNSTTWLLERFYFNLDLYKRIKNREYSYGEHFIDEVQLMYVFISIVDSFFSWLEHICILMLSVSDYSNEKDNIIEFIGKDWTTKYNRIFKPNENKDYAKKYNMLKNIKEDIRNTYTHGGIRKNNNEVLVHWKGIGAVPYNLSNKNIIPNIKIQSFYYDYEKDINNLKEFISDLKQDRMRHKYIIAESGLDIRFDKKIIEKMKKAMFSDEDIEDFLRYECGYQDAIQNFEL